MSTYSEHVHEWNHQDWRFVGEEIERRRFEEEEHEECFDVAHPDKYFPMMNYAYPLDNDPTDDEIQEIHERTGCTVVQKKSTGAYYLALTGGGMDLSQDIGLAYLVTDDWIPADMVNSIYARKALSLRGDDYQELLKGIQKTVEAEKNKLNRTLEEVEEQLENLKVES